METLIILALVALPIFFGIMAVTLRGRMSRSLEGFSREMGLQKTEDFFSRIESEFKETPATLLDVRKHHSHFPQSAAGGAAPTDIYLLDIKAAYFASGVRRICKKSLFSLVPCRSETAVEKLLEIVKKNKRLTVFYNRQNPDNAYISVDRIKSWNDSRLK